MKQKLRILAAVTVAAIGCLSSDAWAQTVADLEAAGWTKVESLTDVDVSQYYFVFVDAGSSGYIMASDACDERPFYSSISNANPLIVTGQTWQLSGSNDTYSVKTGDGTKYFNSGPDGWNDFMGATNDNADYKFTFADGIYSLTTTNSKNQLVGPWNNNGKVEVNGEALAANKSNGQAPGFYIYSMLRSDYDTKREALFAQASSANPLNITPCLINPEFDFSDLRGWTGSGTYRRYTDAAGFDGTIGFVEYCNWGGAWTGSVSQTLFSLPYGRYRIKALGQASSSNVTVTLDVNGVTANLKCIDATGGNVDANGNEVEAGAGVAGWQYMQVECLLIDKQMAIQLSSTATYKERWANVDHVVVEYLGPDLADFQEALNETVLQAQTLVGSNLLPSAAENELKSIILTNNPSGGYDTADDYVNAANTIKAAYEKYQLLVEPYEVYKAMRDDFVKAGILNAEGVYTDKDGAVDALNAAIKAADTAVEAAETAEAVTAQTAAIRAAAMIFVKTVEMTEGKYFDLTYLMVNPGFDDNTTDGWVINKTGDLNTSEQCNEFYQATFDMYQELEGLPNGSYTLSVKAFMRPGWSEDVASDYEKGINKVSAKLYVNNDESVIKNIMEDKQPEKLFSNGTWMDDSFVSGGYVPNCMAGAQKYFEKGLYDTEVAALVNDGKLKLGFKNDVSANGYWIIFDDFRLHYYGASELIYDKQYLVQLKAEAEATLNNALYDKVNGAERMAFGNAISQMPAEETEAAYEAVIDAIKQAQENFVAALSAYERLDAAIATAKGVDADCADAEKVFAGEETTADEAVAAANALYSDMLSVTAVEFGFGKGEYAPYDHVENLRTLAEAQRALDNVASMEVAALDGIVRRVKTMEWTANVTEVNAIYNPTFALSENDGNIAQWTTNDGTVIGGAFHSRAFVIGSDNGNYDNLATFNQEGEIRSCAYFRFDTTNSQTTTEYIYGEVEGYTLPLKGQTLYELSFDGGIWGNNVGDARDVKVIVYDGNNEVLATYRSTFTTRINAGGQASHVDFVFETKDAGNYKIAVTNGNDGWNAMAVSNFQLVETSVASVVLSDDKTPNYASGTYSSVNVSRTLYSGLNTFAVPFALDEAAVVEKLGESAAVYELSQAANDELKFAKVASVEPNKPYLVYVESDVTGLQFEDVELSAAEAVTVENGSWAMVSNYTPKYVHHADYYLLAVQNGKECVAPAGESAYVNGMRAYFLYRGEVENLVNARIVLGDETTSVTVVSAGVGQEAVDVYDVRGILVRKQVNATEALKGLPKGIYVVNGKKVVR